MSRSRRLAKLETTQRRQGGFFVVPGHSDEEFERRIDEEFERRIDELKASGKVPPDSLFVCIKKFPFEDDDREG